MILLSHGLSAPGFFPAAIDIASCMHAHRRHYDVIVLRFRLLFSRILIDYKKNENKTPSKIYEICVRTAFIFAVEKVGERVWRPTLHISSLSSDKPFVSSAFLPKKSGRFYTQVWKVTTFHW